MPPGNDDLNLEEAFDELSRKVDESNREIKEYFEKVYGDIEDNEEQIHELAYFAQENRERAEENHENIDDLWNEFDDLDTGSPYIDFSGIENTVRYIGGGLQSTGSRIYNFFSGTDIDFDEDKRDTLKKGAAVAAGAAVVADYTNIVPGDKNAGDGFFRGGECGWDMDGLGIYGEQRPCSAQPENQDNGTGNGREPSDTVDDVQTPYEREIELSDEDIQYAIENTEGTDEELTNIKNVNGDMNDFGYDPSSDEFYVEVETEDESTRLQISEEAYWNAVE